MNTTTRIPIVLMSVEETAQAVSISVKTVRSLIRQGRLRAVNFGTRMTRIYLHVIWIIRQLKLPIFSNNGIIYLLNPPNLLEE